MNAPPRAIAICSVTLALLAASSARADGVSDVEALLEEPVVSTASKAAETRATAPATSTTITAEDLRRYGIRNIAEAIDFLSLGMVTQAPLRSTEVGSRGVLITGDYGNHVLLLLDGHMLNEQWSGVEYLDEGAGIPLEIVDHIEIIVGPGSVLYGSNAMLGVINVITKRAKDYRGTHLVVEGQLPTAFRAGAGAGYEFKIRGVPAEITAHIEYFARNGPAFSFGPQDYGLDAVTGLPKRFSADQPATGIWGGVARRSFYTRAPSGYLRFVVGPFEMSVRAAMFDHATPYFNYVNTFPLDFDEPNSLERERWFGVDLRHRAVFSPKASLSSRLYGDLYTYREVNISSAAEDCLPGLGNGCTRDYNGHSRWLGLEEQLSIDWFADGRFTTLLAMDARLRQLGSYDDISDRVTGRLAATNGAYDRGERQLALYAQQTARLAPFLGLNAGVRFDLDDRVGGHLSPRAAIDAETWPGGRAKIIYAEAFRAPGAYEVFNSDPTLYIAPGRLDPEIARTIEGTFEQKLGAQRLLVGVFRSYFRDMVALTDATDAEIQQAISQGKLVAGTTSAVRYRNVGSIDAWGFQAGFEGTRLAGRLRYGLSFTAAYSRKQAAAGEEARPLTVAPQMFGNARIAYDIGAPFPTVALAGQVIGSRPVDRAYDGGFNPVPYASAQGQMRATVSGPVPKVKGLSYRLSGNVAFAPRGPYVVGPLQYATPDHPQPELVPAERYRVLLGLQYDLPF